MGLEGGIDLDLQRAQPHQQADLLPRQVARAETLRPDQEQQVAELVDGPAIPADPAGQRVCEQGAVPDGHHVVHPAVPVGDLELDAFLRGRQRLLGPERVEPDPLFLHALEQRRSHQAPDHDQGEDRQRQRDSLLVPNRGHPVPLLPHEPQRGLFRSAISAASVSSM